MSHTPPSSPYFAWGQALILNDQEDLKVGDLVTTVVGEIGLIIGHDVIQKYFPKDKTKYYQVLVKGEVFNYIPGTLKKFNNNLTNKK